MEERTITEWCKTSNFNSMPDLVDILSISDEQIGGLLIKGNPRIHKQYSKASMRSFYLFMFQEFFRLMIEDIAETGSIFIIKEKPLIKIWIGKRNKKQTFRSLNTVSDFSIEEIGYRLNVFKMSYYRKGSERMYAKKFNVPKRIYSKIKNKNYFTDEI